MFDEEQQFIALKAKILKDRGLDCGQYKTNYLKRRIAVRMRAHRVESYREYMKILDCDTVEYNKLMDCLTINVTQFFRDSDTFEAMTSPRPYRKALSIEDACAEIARCKGTQCDPEVADAFLRIIKSSVLVTDSSN